MNDYKTINIYLSPDVVVPEHHQMSAQLQTGLLYEVSFPVTWEYNKLLFDLSSQSLWKLTFEYLEQVAGVDVTWVFSDQLTQDYPTVSLEWDS